MEWIQCLVNKLDKKLDSIQPTKSVKELFVNSFLKTSWSKNMEATIPT